MKIAITGATGFIGRQLTAHLVERGDELCAVVRPESRHQPPPGVRVVRAPLEASTLSAAFVGVDVVVHLAAIVSAVRESDYAAVNVEGTRAVAHATRAAGARLVHLSSLAAAGPAPAGNPRSEEDSPAPITAYGCSKLDGEHAVRGIAGLSWIILRPGVVYGPGDRAMLPLFRLAEHGILPLVGRRDAAYTLIHVRDAVRAIEAAMTSSAEAETLFVGHPRPATTRMILEAIQAAVGRRAVRVPVPSSLLRVASIAGDVVGALTSRPSLLNGSRLAELNAEGFVCHVDRLRECLGVVAEIDLERGLAETAASYRREGWL